MSFTKSIWSEFVLAIAVLIGLYTISLSNYLLFHTIAEVFSAVVAFGIFVVAWNSREILKNQYLLFIGCAYLFVAGSDMLHMLAFKGMGVFADSTANTATQLWLVGRFIETGALLVAPFLMTRQFETEWVFFVFAIITTLLLSSIFYFQVFPAAYIPDIGLTPFKRISEYIVSALLIVSLLAFIRHKPEFDLTVYKAIVLSIVFTIISELCFTLYFRVDEFANFIGHYFKILSFYFMYVAIVKTGIKNPFHLLFRELSQEQEALEQERNFVATILNNAPAIITVCDRHGRILNINSECRELIGIELDEVRNRYFWDVLMPNEESAKVSEILKQVSELDSPIEHESGCIDAGGNIRMISWSHTILRTNEGDISHIVSIGVDITERKRAQEALERAKLELEHRVQERTAELREKYNELAEEIAERRKTEAALRMSEQRYRSIGELIPYGVWQTDVHGNPTYLSENFLEMLGITWEECLAHGWMHRLHPDDIDATKHDFKHCIKQSNLWDYEHRVISKGGELKTVLCRGVPIRNGEGEVISWVGIHLDITDRKNAEEEIRKNQELYKTLYENTPAMLHSIDDSSRIVAVNNFWLESMGYDRDEVIGKSPVEFLTEESAEYAIHSGLPNFFSQGFLKDIEYKMVKKDGDTMDVLFTAITQPTLAEAGYKSLAVSIDITKLKQTEAALENKASELAQSNRDLEQFAFAASHDLQEPLRNVAVCLQILKKSNHEKLASEAHALIDIAVGSVHSMRRTIDELLVYSRITTRGKPFCMVNLNEIVSKVLEEFGDVIIKNNADIQVFELPIVFGDYDQLMHVFRHLLDNALKFRSDKAPIVIITAESADGEWKIAVSDNGIGIEEQYWDRVFIIFQRLNNRMVYPGTGIGLAMAKRIIERHLGRIWIDSELGRGTTIFFTLPPLEKSHECGSTTNRSVARRRQPR